MVVNRDGTVEQKTHYYPYGPRRHRESIFMLSARRRGFSRGKVIGDISTNESLQKYKFEGKELDRSFGLDTYDVHARQYFAMAPMWDRVDKLAGDYPDTSPYAYCGGDPVNRGDYDGKEVRVFIETKSFGHVFVTTGTGGNTTVYTYGRFGATNQSSGSGSSTSGEGVLLVKKGESAAKYINEELDEKNAHVFSFPKVEDSKMDSYFMNMIDSSDAVPTGKYKETTDVARVINKYNLFTNNCATTTMEALNVCGVDTNPFYSISPDGLLSNLLKYSIWESLMTLFGVDKIVEIVSQEEIKQEINYDENK